MGDHNLAGTSANAAAGLRLRAGRALLGMDQAVLADHLTRDLGVTVSQQAVSAWERGVRTVPAVVLEATEEAVRAAGWSVAR